MCDDAPVCAWIDPPAVQAGEYLPFRWDLEIETDDLVARNACDTSVGKVIEDSVLCHFTLQNGKNTPDESQISFVLPCI